MPKRLIPIAVTSALFLLLAGCLRAEPEEVVALTWWVTFPVESAEYAALQVIAEAYADQSGHVVDLVPVPWNEIAPGWGGYSKLAATQESGTGPDLWGPVPHSWTEVFATEGQALPLESSQIRDASQYLDVAMRACRFDGTQYALPVLIDSAALIYNKTLVPNVPKSFEELLDLARDLTDADRDLWGLVLPLLSQYHVYPFMAGYGGYIVRCERDQCDPGDIGLNNEGAVRGVQFIADLYLKEKLFPEPLTDRAAMHSYGLRLFAEGKAAMLIDGSWALPEIRASNVDYGVVAIPTLPETDGRPKPLVIVQAIYVSAHSRHPAEAVDFLNYLAGPEGAVAMLDALGQTPVRRDVLRSPSIRENRDIMAWQDQVTIGVPVPNVPDYVWTLWGQALEEAVLGFTPVQDALDKAVEQIKGYMEG